MSIISGTSSNDILYGTAGADTIRGGDGNDALVGSAGADVLDGGSGVDMVNYINSPASVSINLATGTASGGHAAGDTLISIERLGGSNYADFLTGGTGNDWFDGSAGNDTINGGADSDTASYAGAPIGVIVNLATQTAIDGNRNSDTLISIENITGSNQTDSIIGDAGNNILSGLAGNDALTGGGGNDTLIGGGGADTLLGGDGDDRLYIDADDTVINGGDGDDIIFALGTVGVSLDLATSLVEVAYGCSGNDTFNAANAIASVQIYGDDGADVLTGGAGNDTLTGGAGNDTFRFAYGNGGLDTIADFQTGQDRIELIGVGFSELVIGQLDPGLFAIDVSTDDTTRFIFDTVTSTLSYDPDGIGVASATPFLNLNARMLVADDLWVGANQTI